MRIRSRACWRFVFKRSYNLPARNLSIFFRSRITSSSLSHGFARCCVTCSSVMPRRMPSATATAYPSISVRPIHVVKAVIPDISSLCQLPQMRQFVRQIEIQIQRIGMLIVLFNQNDCRDSDVDVQIPLTLLDLDSRVIQQRAYGSRGSFNKGWQGLCSNLGRKRRYGCVPTPRVRLTIASSGNSAIFRVFRSGSMHGYRAACTGADKRRMGLMRAPGVRPSSFSAQRK